MQVFFLPWVKLKQSLKLGPVTFWPYYKEANERVKDPEVRVFLDKFFKLYVDYQGKPVDTITVCSYKDIAFRPLNISESLDLRRAVDILIFAAITTETIYLVCSNNKNWLPPSADVFELVVQNFHPGIDSIAIKAGNSLIGCWKIGEVTFSKPWTTGGILESSGIGAEKVIFNEFKKLIDEFDKCFSTDFPENVRERLFRSLEWFRFAHVQNEQVSELSRLVMMATAFEILLEFPENEKRKCFVDYMEKHIASVDFYKDTRTTKSGKSFTLSLAGCWAWDFYGLRNRIVHGDSVSPKDWIYKDWITHLIVADLVFWECIKIKLFEHKCIGNDIYSITKETRDIFIKPSSKRLLGFDKIHEALCWIPKKEISTDEPPGSGITIKKELRKPLSKEELDKEVEKRIREEIQMEVLKKNTKEKKER